MENIIIFLIIFLVTLILSILNYVKNAEKLIVYHKYSLILDVLDLFCGTFLVIIAFIYFDKIPEYNLLLWVQVIIATALFNIHLVRFIIHIKTKNKYFYSNKKRKY